MCDRQLSPAQPYDGIVLCYSKAQQNPNRTSGLEAQDRRKESERWPNTAHQQGHRPQAVLHADIHQGKETGARGSQEEHRAPASALGDDVREAEHPWEQGARSPSHWVQALEERGPKDG